MNPAPAKLKHILTSIGGITAADETLLLDKLQPATLAKGEYFVQQGQVCSKVGFLLKGIIRAYHIANDKEYTSYFNFGERNQFVTSFSSFITRKPSAESLHALDDCELLVISHADLHSLYEQSPALQKLGRIMAEANYVLAMQRIYSLQHQSAQERYAELLHIYPNLINQVPHHYVASYLGVTPESLSRIRKAK